MPNAMRGGSGKLLLLSLLVAFAGLLPACDSADTDNEPPAEEMPPEDGNDSDGASISGTVTAPPEGDVQGTAVVACYQRDCEDSRGRAIVIEESGTNAGYEITGLAEGSYGVIAFKDVNGNEEVDGDDYVSEVRDITPPAENEDFTMQASEGGDEGNGDEGDATLTGTLTFTLTAYTGRRRNTYNLDLGQERAVLAVSATEASRNADGQYGLIQSCGSSDGVQVAFADAQGVVTDLATSCIDKTVDYRYPKISPDGGHIAFIDYRQDPGTPPVDLVHTTVVANREGEEVAAFPGYSGPAWTPGGQLLLSGEQTSRVPFGLYVTDENLEDPTRFSGDLINAYAGAPNVHPGGGRVAFAYNGGLWQMNLDGTGFEVLYQYEYPLAYPAWSPSGDRLAFVDTELIYGPRAIFVLDAASGEVSEVGLSLEGTDHALGPLSWIE